MALLDFPQISNAFTQYDVDASSFFLHSEQVAQIQTQLSIVAQQQVALVFDPANSVQFGLDQAFLAGQMQAFQYLLDLSEANVASISTDEE